MAEERDKDMVSRLLGAGEEVVGRITDLPGAKQLIDMTNATRERLDELQRRVMGLGEIERRVDELERRLEALEGAKASPPEPSGRGTQTPAAKRAREAVEKSGDAQA